MRATTAARHSPPRRCAAALVAALALGSVVAAPPAGAGAEGYVLATAWDAVADEDVAAAPDGTVWSVDGGTTLNHFSASGGLLGSFTLEGLSRARAITVGPDGALYVTDDDAGPGSVVAFSPTAVPLRAYTLTDEAYARGVDVAPTGEVLVTNASSDRVEVFSPDGTWLRNLGSSGAGPGQVDRPDDVVVGADGAVFVSDYSNRRVQKFDLATGAYLGGWGQPGVGPGQLDNPYAVDLTPTGNVLVFDKYALQEFTPDGALVSRTDHGLTLLFDNQGMSVDAAGAVYTTQLRGLARFTPVVASPPPPPPPPPGNPEGRVALAKKKIAAKGGKAKVALSCRDGSRCRGTITITAAPTKSKKSRKVLAKGRYSLDEGRGAVRVSLTRKGRQLLATRSQAKVRVTLKPTTAGRLAPVVAKGKLVRSRKG